RPEAALPLYRQAAEEAPGDLEIVHGLLRLAEMTGGEDSTAARSWALERLAGLRPDNLVVMLHQGQEAVRRGDRAAASRAALRIRELLWQAPPVAETALAALIGALEEGDLDRARVG